MKIAFIEARNEFDLTFSAPMAYKYLKSYLLEYSKHKNEIEFSSYLNAKDIPDDTDIIAVSTLSHTFDKASQIVRDLRIRLPKSFMLMGGNHISFCPETLPIECNLGVLFEGEETFLEIVDAICEERHEDVYKVDGIVYRTGEESFHKTNPRALIEPLDRIPLPVDEGDRSYIFSSRGCPYKCAFCSSAYYWDSVRFHSADYVVRSIEHLLEKSPDTEIIEFWDDLVIANKSRFKEIVEEVEKRGINEKVKFGFAVRANLVNEDLCKLLKRLNVNSVSFGAESGNDRILKILKGDSVSVLKNQTALDLLHKYNIPVSCSFVLGTPSETESEINDTFSFIEKNVLEKKMLRYVINILMPLPGTMMWEYGKEKGLVEENPDWNRLKVYASYTDSRFSSIHEWIETRISYNCYYLNEETVAQKRLFELMLSFDEKMKSLKD